MATTHQEPFDPDKFLDEFGKEMDQKRSHERELERIHELAVQSARAAQAAQKVAECEELTARQILARQEAQSRTSMAIIVGIGQPILAFIGFLAVLSAFLDEFVVCSAPTITWGNVTSAMTEREIDTRKVHLDTLIKAFEGKRQERCRMPQPETERDFKLSYSPSIPLR